MNIDEKTIRHIFDDYADELGSKFRFVTPRFMGIDELKIVGAYRADPHAAWQRGSNENTNGLVRQYLPKGCNLADFSDAHIQHIEDRINRRPRKRLGFKTLEQKFNLSFNRVALQS